MAIPKVFISSTCYDLKYIRENIKSFISSIGYDSILSEDGDIYYNTNIHTHDACLSELSTCQMFVLIIGGRYGGEYKSEKTSITNTEYREAIELQLPIFTLVEQSVYSEHYVYTKNKKNVNIDETQIFYPSVDNIKIFNFIDEVRNSLTNNAIFPFSDYSSIEQYLRKQWAGMMHNFLTTQAESKRVSNLFEQIQTATDKIEFYTSQMLKKIDVDKAKVIAQMHDIIAQSPATDDLKEWNFAVTPSLINKYPNLDALCEYNIVTDDYWDETHGITSGGPPYKIGEKRYNKLSKSYNDLYNEINELFRKIDEADLNNN